MKKHLILLVILLVCYKNTTIEECSDFDNLIQESCSDLSSSDKYCYYSESRCHEWYKECGDYRIDDTNTFFNEYTCKKIIPSSSIKKCWPNDNKNECVEKYKECNELSISDCLNQEIYTSGDKRCKLIGGKKCEEHSDICNGLTRDNCENNIPNDYQKKCVWNGNSCVSEDRKCTDFIEFSFFSTNVDGSTNTEINRNFCKNLKATDPEAVCFYDYERGCVEAYKNCRDIKEYYLIKCEKTIPLNSEQTDYDKKIKCVLDELEGKEICKQESRKCEDYNKRIKDSSQNCLDLSPKENTNNKMCFFNGTICEEIYITCTGYNIIDENKRKADICNSIIPRDISNKEIILEKKKCSFNSDQKLCEEKDKECNDIDEKSCNNFRPLSIGNNRKCIFKNNECIEEYMNCESYPNIPQVMCESITPLYISDNHIYRCSFKGNICQKEKIMCEDYKGNDKEYCESLSVNLDNPNEEKCAIRDNKCVKQFMKCEFYNGNNKTECESIVVDDQYSRCFFEKDKECIQKKKLCSEYLGENKYECSQYGPSYKEGDIELKECVIENGKCIEKYKEPTYKYCSDYRGTDETICVSIQPHKIGDEDIPDYTSRCIFESEFCKRVSIDCSEAKDSEECFSIIPDDDKKRCVFKNDVCVEQYRSCSVYNNENTIDKTVCESILIEGNNENKNDHKQKCVFKEGENDSQDTCVLENRKCEEFNIDLISYKCLNINPSNPTKKCIYKNKICTSIDKTCSELGKILNLPRDANITAICEAAETTSSDKICVANTQENGCEEVDKSRFEEEESIKNKKNSCSINYLNKIILLIFCLLI